MHHWKYLNIISIQMILNKVRTRQCYVTAQRGLVPTTTEKDNKKSSWLQIYYIEQ